MKYLKLDDDVFVKYDGVTKTTQILSKSELLNQLESLNNIPQIPSDKVLLDWAKENYPGIKNIKEDQKKIDVLEVEVAKLDNAVVV